MFEYLKCSFGNVCLGKTAALERYKHFRRGKTLAEDTERTGQLTLTRTSVNIEVLRSHLDDDHQVTCRIIENIDISKSMVQQILTLNSQKRKMYARFIPHSRVTSALFVSWPAQNLSKWPEFLQKDNNKRWKLVFCQWPWSQMPECRIG